MSAADPVVGAAFVEIHARASADLDREMQSTVNQATSRVNGQQSATAGSVAEARQQLQLWKKDLENVDTADLAKVQELTQGAAGWQETLAERTKATGIGLDDVGKKGAASMAGIGAAASTALPIILAIGGAAAAAIAAFQDQATKGLLGPEARGEAEAFSGELKELQGTAVDLTAAVGAGLVPALTDTLEVVNALLGPLADNGEAITVVTEAIMSAINPLGGVISAYKDWRGETREASTALEGLTDSVSMLTLAQERNRVETERAKKSSEDATRELDDRIGATVRALQGELERADAMVAVADAQEALREADAELADSQGRTERGARRVADAQRALRDAIQAVADANQDVIESDQRVAKARRELADATFRMGSGSQDALDAADELQRAEYDAGRAREEASDSVEDVAKREQDLATARAEQAKEAEEAARRRTEAQEDLDDALRNAARVEADYQIAVRESRGETVSARDALAIYGDALAKVANDDSPKLRDELARLKAALDALPSTKTIELLLNTQAALEGLSRFAAQVPDAVGLALTDIATGAPLAGTDANTRVAATTAPTGTVATRSTAGTVPQVNQYVTETADPVHLAHELGWIYTP